jgi:hypothetical protein
VPYDIAEKTPSAIRATQSGELVFLFYMLITLLLFFILIMELKKGLKIEKYLFAFAVLFSAPFIHQFERANIIFVALLFLIMFIIFKDSKNKIVRELSLIALGVAGAIKIYPAVFGLLLIKEKRYDDAFKVFIYSAMLFILPFFAIGGIDSMFRLYNNFLHTSDLTTNWGLGYSVNIQNMLRIIFAFFGDFTKLPVYFGSLLSYIVLILGLLSAYYLRSKWKTVALLATLMCTIPSISYEYTLIFMLIPIAMFLDQEEKKKNYLYLVCFILLFIPFTLNQINFINKGFENPILPLTYGVLIQNIVLMIMIVSLIKEGLADGKAQGMLAPLQRFVMPVVIRIYGMKHNGLKDHILLIGKILLTVIIIIVIFGDTLFSNVYHQVKPYHPIYSILKPVEQQSGSSNLTINSIEPQYLHFGDKVIVKGTGFSLRKKMHVRVMSSNGEINPQYWSDNQFIFSVPLDWKLGKVDIWVEKPATKKSPKTVSNKSEIKVIDRLGAFNEDDINYFGQIKYLDKDTQEINNFENFKFREYKITRWIPTIVFQTYADIIEVKASIKSKAL